MMPEVSQGMDLEIIVVDNASTDGTVQALQSSPATVIANDTNVGYGRASNMGLRAAAGRYLLVLNPDTVLQGGSLASLIDFVTSHPRAGIVAPRLLNPDGSIQPAAFRFPTLLMAAIDLFPLPRLIPGRIRSWLYSSSLNGRYGEERSSTTPFRIDHPLGACLLLRCEAYQQCGGFDERIFMYSEEIDLAIRYARAGWECWQVPASRVVHFGGHSTRQRRGPMFVELWRSRLYIYAKYYPRLAQKALRTMLRFAMLGDLVAGAWYSLATPRSRRVSGRAHVAKAVLRMMDRP
jgi:GT2 family glycosyltransferase